LAMDKRNPDTWLVPEKIKTPVKEIENLVPNPSFEKNDGKIVHRAEVRNHIPDWKVSAGTPDYYRIKKLNTVDGYAILGCRFYTEKFNDIEFISAELKETLEKDKVYCFKVYLRLRETSIYGVNAFGVLFSPEIPKADELMYGEAKPSVKHNGGAGLSFKTKWMELSCTYKARGDEQFITLGSFANADSMSKIKLKGEIFEAYYYFDMVQLFALERGMECPCGMGSRDIPEISENDSMELSEKEAPEVFKTFVIRNIFFENDKWDLLPESYNALDSLYDVIDENGFKKIEISGHTSNTGSRERNLLLSKNRAEAVKKYLVKKGLSSKMFVCKGYGPDQPIADNETEEGQAENRRVEFTIIE
ncbi:MAG: OmpA family protein, partial [Bacteroidia bacterium]